MRTCSYDVSSLRKFYRLRTLQISHLVWFWSIGFEFGIESYASKGLFTLLFTAIGLSQLIWCMVFSVTVAIAPCEYVTLNSIQSIYFGKNRSKNRTVLTKRNCPLSSYQKVPLIWLKVAFLGIVANFFKQNVSFLPCDSFCIATSIPWRLKYKIELCICKVSQFSRLQPGDEIKVLCDQPDWNTTEKSLTGKKLEIDWEQWKVHA